jgi:hypothetical protein
MTKQQGWVIAIVLLVLVVLGYGFYTMPHKETLVPHGGKEQPVTSR